MPTNAARSAQTLHVHDGSGLRVSAGANAGDALGPGADLALDDIYRLADGAARRALTLEVSAMPPFTVAPDSATGRAGAAIHLDTVATLMAPDGATVELLVLVETDATGGVAATHALPLAPLRPRTDYALVGLDPGAALQRFAQAACVSFTAGTLIALATGAQVPVERLRPGDRVLTRDDGAQPIRWIGHHTIRAEGVFAPIRIATGALNNARPLLLSPDHRLFVYQRQDRLGAGRAEVFVRARHLLNGTSVTRAEGGFVEYYQMLFDSHQILYAEGIAAEAMQIDGRTRAALPDELAGEAAALIPRHGLSRAQPFEVGAPLLARPETADLLRRASLG